MNTMFKSPKLSPQRLVTLAMLIALAFAIGKLSIPIIPQQLIISPTFIVNVMIGMIGGPIWAFISLAILDIVDNLSSGAGNFIIWWTLLEAVQGLFYGLFFYQKSLSWTNKKDWLHVTIATAIINHYAYRKLYLHSFARPDLLWCPILGTICSRALVKNL